MNRVAITGVTGYLGSHIAKGCLSSHWTAAGLKRTHSNTARLPEGSPALTLINVDSPHFREELLAFRPEAIIHCATLYGRKGESDEELRNANLDFPLELLHHAKECGVQAFVNIDTTIPRDLNRYSYWKGQFVEAASQFAPPLTLVNVEMQHFYGPGDDTSKFVSWLLHTARQSGDPIALTPGEQRRDFIYIKDAVTACLVILNKSLSLPSGFHAIELGSGTVFSIKELAHLMQELCPSMTRSFAFGAIPYREGEPMEQKANIEKLTSWGWAPAYTLREGLTEMIKMEDA